MTRPTANMSKRNRRRIFGSPAVMSPVNKKLNFDLGEEDAGVEGVVEEGCPGLARLEELPQFPLELGWPDCSEELEDKFSPCRTRSGRVYESGLKRRRWRVCGPGRDRQRTESGQSCGGNLADWEGESDTEHPGRFSLHRGHQPVGIASSPLGVAGQGAWPESPPPASPSPPSHTMRAMRLFDPLSSPGPTPAPPGLRSAPRGLGLKTRLLLGAEPRRHSFPLARTSQECDSTSASERPKTANINPFTPEGMIATNKKRHRSQNSHNNT